LYETQRRMSEYYEQVERLRLEWRAYLAAVPPLGRLSEILSREGRKS
jgi:hypothetical protein